VSSSPLVLEHGSAPRGQERGREHLQCWVLDRLIRRVRLVRRHVTSAGHCQLGERRLEVLDELDRVCLVLPPLA